VSKAGEHLVRDEVIAAGHGCQAGERGLQACLPVLLARSG
jgi:hypothetical protein